LGAALERDDVRGEAYNFSYGMPLTAREVVDAIREQMDRNDLEPVVLNTARAEIPHQHLDSTKARTQLGWRPSVHFDEGLARTVSWYRETLAS
jgi:nucleoside-diphosphate-sugar epimerase